ncbi:MAG TPA: Rrf2 family transcriptional regulator [Acidobacteriaceae bacterium]|jgi:Rrf2 family protein|nr:Rrf2 family transcriptional regulator [Acidobacteriaceae bacterium]
MLRLTKKADYGLMALKYLAEHPNEPSLSARDIAQAYHIPPQLLAKILQRLAKVGILRSHAGMSGGYSLLKSPHDISAFEVIHAIDGPLFITSCGTSDSGCDLTDSCTIKEPLARVNDSISDLLRRISISDLAEPADGAHARPGPGSGPELVTIQL